MPGNARESEKNARGKITQIITFVHDKNESLNFNESLNVSNYIIYGIARNGRLRNARLSEKNAREYI